MHNKCVFKHEEDNRFNIASLNIKPIDPTPQPPKGQFSLYDIFNMEKANGDLLGEASADDVILFARRMKIMKAKLIGLKKQVD